MALASIKLETLNFSFFKTLLKFWIALKQLVNCAVN
jgi:hypothetical protein